MIERINNIFYKNNKSSGIQYKDNSQPNKKLTPSSNLQTNKRYLQNIFSKCGDIMIREINIMSDSRYASMIVYVENMISSQTIEDGVIPKLTIAPSNYTYISNLQEYCMSLFGIDTADMVDDMNKAVDAIVEGEMVLFINGINRAFTIDIKQAPSRSIEEPATENVVRGPREGFTESLGTNICLIRKKIKSSNLKVEFFKIGKQTKSDLTVIYMSNIANSKIVEEVKNRINKIDIDSVLATSYVEEYIDDNPFSLFPTAFKTEKPDVASGKLLEGRVGILVDSSPVFLSVPSIFTEFFMSPDDYYLRFYVATLSRLIRTLAFAMSIALPGTFVALVSYHQELLPTSLIISIINARANIPFPPMFEALFMLITYLILQEADIRIPKTMGQSVSVVGGLVLGQAAISAGIVSAHMIIVVAFSAVCALAVPTPELQVSLAYVRFGLLFLGGIGGMVGLTCGLIALLIHLISLRSFGAPYFAPFAPLKPKELIDSIIRVPLWAMKTRPKTITWKTSTRRKGRPAAGPITEEDKEKNTGE